MVLLLQIFKNKGKFPKSLVVRKLPPIVRKRYLYIGIISRSYLQWSLNTKRAKSGFKFFCCRNGGIPSLILLIILYFYGVFYGVFTVFCDKWNNSDWYITENITIIKQFPLIIIYLIHSPCSFLNFKQLHSVWIFNEINILFKQNNNGNNFKGERNTVIYLPLFSTAS